MRSHSNTCSQSFEGVTVVPSAAPKLPFWCILLIRTQKSRFIPSLFPLQNDYGSIDPERNTTSISDPCLQNSDCYRNYAIARSILIEKTIMIDFDLLLLAHLRFPYKVRDCPSYGYTCYAHLDLSGRQALVWTHACMEEGQSTFA